MPGACIALVWTLQIEELKAGFNAAAEAKIFAKLAIGRTIFSEPS